MGINATCIRLYVDSGRTWCGVRGFVVLERGRRWARLLYVPTLTGIKIPIAQLANGRPSAPAPDLAKRIRRVQRERKRLGLAWSRPDTRAALALLKT